LTKKKNRGASGKSLFPWKSKHGPELKKTLLKIIYLHGMHLSKGSDRLPKIKKLDDKWKFIADEFWKQPCCQLLRMTGEYKDVQPPSNLSVRSELGHILTEVSTAMNWNSDSMVNLSQREGDLPEYETLVMNILMEQEKEKAAEELKQMQEKEKEKNEVSILLSGLSKSSEAELKVTSKAIRKRDRERSNPSPDFTISTNDTSSSNNSKIMNSFGGKAMQYLDRMMAENDEDEVTFVSKKSSRHLDGDGYDRNIEQLMLDKYQNINWLNCMSVKTVKDDEHYDQIQAQDIGIEVIINVFCRNVFDIDYFKSEMQKMQLGYMSAHKLYLHLRKTYDTLIPNQNYVVQCSNGMPITPK